MKKMQKIVSVMLIASMAGGMVSCGGNSRPTTDGGLTGNISLSGAFALYPLAVKWADEFQKQNPGVRIDLSAGGAGKGMTDALAGVVDFGMVSREIYPREIEQGAVPFAVAKDAVVATFNSNNPVADLIMKHGITRDDATKIWITGEAKTWGDVLGTDDTTPLRVYTRSDACGAAETWAKWFGKRQEDLGGTAVFGDPGVAAAVQKDIYGVGLNNIGYVYDNETHLPNPNILVVPIDADEDGVISPDEDFYATKDSLITAISLGKFPSPPARDLYLVSKGVPTDPAVIAFLEYILSDEGQKENTPVGYIDISAETRNEALQLLQSPEK
ncbi:MAG: substrate-binding domain-containing protein [Coprobacter sp.]|nr:substrate-binding domain-containing protein [Coprobacter sp.]